MKGKILDVFRAMCTLEGSTREYFSTIKDEKDINYTKSFWTPIGDIDKRKWSKGYALGYDSRYDAYIVGCLIETENGKKEHEFVAMFQGNGYIYMDDTAEMIVTAIKKHKEAQKREK